MSRERRAAAAGERAPGAGRQALAWVWPLAWPHRGLVALGAAALLVQTGVSLLMPYLVKVGIDQGVVPGDLGVVNRMALAYLALAAVHFLAGRTQALAVARAGQQVLYAVRTRLFGHLQALSLDFYERERTGRIVARMTSDIEAMGDLLTEGLAALVANLITLLGVAVVLAVLDWKLALATLLVAPLLGLGTGWFRRHAAPAWRQVRERAAAVTSQLQEVLTGVRTIQAFRQEPAAARRLAAANDAERRAHQRTIALASVFFPGVEFAGTLATAVVLGLGGALVLQGGLQLGTLAAFLLYLRNLFGPLQHLSELYDTLQAAAAGAERVGAVLAEVPSVREAPRPVRLPRPRGELRLEGVRFAYAAGRPAAGPPARHAAQGPARPGPEVLHGVSLLVPAGSTLALVGPTGAGKSTIAKLVVRFYDPVAGRVLLDGVDLRELALADLRRAVAYVPQEGFLFSGTVAENVAVGRPGASRAEVEAAVAAVGAAEALAALPENLDTRVGQRGGLLSAGERQLVAAARAWIADPAVLVLDEATSHLDAATEARVQRALSRLRQGRTTVVIAHRLATVLDADLVAVIDGGRVAELGPPAELLARGGRFRALRDRWLAGAA